jgi:putative ABC transport system ATP-binding protein
MADKAVITIENLHKYFKVGNQNVPVLKGIDLSIEEGGFSIIFGPSGCGKSTMLHIMLGLENPSRGVVFFNGRDMYTGTSEDDRSDLRKEYVGMIYQQPNWIRSLRVFENVAFPLLLLGEENEIAFKKAEEVLASVEMIDWANYIPTELSSGQQQRVSLARASVTNPKIIIADEPTGNLDYESGQSLMELLEKLNQNLGKTVIMVTHDLEYLDFAKTAIRMFDGKITGVYKGGDKDTILDEVKSKRSKGKKG